MRARVTNLAAAARGFHAADGTTAMVEPGASALLDLADHPAHDAWVEAGDVKVEAEPTTESFSRVREKVSRRSRDG